MLAAVFSTGDGFKVRVVHVAMSLLIVVLIGAAAADVFPAIGSQATSAVRYRAPGTRGANMPVFLLEEDGFPLQCGRADADGERLAIRPYANGRAPLAAPGTTAILMDADLRSLWTLLPDRQRAELRENFSDFVGTFHEALRKTLRSPAFDHEYRPVLRDILGRAFGRAFASPPVRGAWLAAIAAADPKAVDDLVASLRPVAVDKAETVLWDAVSGFTANLFGKKDGTEQGALTRVLTETLKDPRGQDALARNLPPLIETPEVNALVAVLSTQFANALIEDDRFLPLVSRMVNDAYVVADGDARMVAQAAQSLLHSLPTKFIGLRHPGDHNALASFVFATLAKGRQARFVVLASPGHIQRLTASGSVRVLAKIEAP